MREALWFVAAGTALVFLTLGFLLLVMITMNRVLRPRPDPGGQGTGARSGAQRDA